MCLFLKALAVLNIVHVIVGWLSDLTSAFNVAASHIRALEYIICIYLSLLFNPNIPPLQPPTHADR